MLYNAVMRGVPLDVVESLEGNNFTSTIHCQSERLRFFSRSGFRVSGLLFRIPALKFRVKGEG